MRDDGFPGEERREIRQACGEECGDGWNDNGGQGWSPRPSDGRVLSFVDHGAESPSFQSRRLQTRSGGISHMIIGSSVLGKAEQPSR